MRKCSIRLYIILAQRDGMYVIASVASYHLAKGGRPRQINTKCIIFTVYSSHLPIFSYKNLRLCREPLTIDVIGISQKIGNFLSISQNLAQLKIL
jgi:hypothetical protein